MEKSFTPARHPTGRSTSAYNHLMTSFARAGDAGEVLRLLNEMKDSNLTPNTLCYNTAINALATAGRHEEAANLFEEMHLSGPSPNVVSYNIMVKLHSLCSRRFDLAVGVIKMMERCGYRPDTTTYSTLIAGLCRAGRIREALGVLDRMLEEKCPPTVHTFSPIVYGYCSEGRIGEAREMMATMESVGCPPNCVVYNVLIKALCRSGRFGEVEMLFRESGLKGWKPNEVTYNTYMNGLCKGGRAVEAFEQLEMMLGRGLRPTAVNLSILVDCFCHDANVLEAKNLLERSNQFKWDSIIVSYNTLMSRLCEIGGWATGLMIFAQMLKKGIVPNTRTFNILINSLCKAGNLRLAMRIFTSRGFLPNVVTYNTLLYWFYREGNIQEVQHLYSRMDAENITPDMVTDTIMINGLCQEGKFMQATNWFLLSLGDRFDRDTVVVLIHRLAKGRRIKEMLYLFKEMAREGYFPDGFLFDLSIRAFCKAGFCGRERIYDVCVILDNLLRRG